MWLFHYRIVVTVCVDEKHMYLVQFHCVRLSACVFLWKPKISALWSGFNGHYINRLRQYELHQFDMLTHVYKLILIDMPGNGHRENGSYEVMCWIVVEERFAA